MAKQLNTTKRHPFKDSFRRRTESEEPFEIPPEMFFPQWHMPKWMGDEFMDTLFNLIQHALSEETLEANRKAYDLWRNEMKTRTK